MSTYFLFLTERAYTSCGFWTQLYEFLKVKLACIHWVDYLNFLSDMYVLIELGYVSYQLKKKVCVLQQKRVAFRV